jgi:hypothetical protein
VGGFASGGVMAFRPASLTNRKSEFRFVKSRLNKAPLSQHLHIHLLMVLMAGVTSLHRLNRDWREFALNPFSP